MPAGRIFGSICINPIYRENNLSEGENGAILPAADYIVALQILIMDPTVGYWPVKETSQWPLNSFPSQQAKDLRDGFGYDDATLPHTHTTYVSNISCPLESTTII